MKIVVVTGTSRGMGKAIAERFLQEGWQVIGTSTSGKSPIKHPHFKIYKLNIENGKSIEQFVKTLYKQKEGLGVLINNAGIYLENDDSPIPESALRKTLEVNLIGLIILTEKLIPLIKDGGSIVNMSSSAGSITDAGDAHRPSYQISKVGVNMYTRCLARALRNRNITVSSLDPGWVRTDMGGLDADRDPREPAKEMYELATSKVDSGFFWHRGKKRLW